MRIITLLVIMSTSFAIAGVYEELVGTNIQGDKIYANATICRNTSGDCEKFKTSFHRPFFQRLSGNVVILSDSSSGRYQIADTVTGKRFNIRNCNGPYVVALSETRALINDCGGLERALINMETGERTYSKHWINGASFFTPHGTIIKEHNTLKLLNSAGNILWEVQNVSEMAEISPVGEDSIAIKSLNEVLIINLKNGEKTTMCSGLNVLSLDVRYYDTGIQIVCSAEESDGTPVLQYHDL